MARLACNLQLFISQSSHQQLKAASSSITLFLFFLAFLFFPSSINVSAIRALALFSVSSWFLVCSLLNCTVLLLYYEKCSYTDLLQYRQYMQFQPKTWQTVARCEGCVHSFFSGCRQPSGMLNELAVQLCRFQNVRPVIHFKTQIHLQILGWT